MTIAPGDSIPNVTLQTTGPDGPAPAASVDLFKGRVVVFGVPGAFTPTCSGSHVPGFVQHADAIKAKGVDSILCLAVNDAFVMGAWGKDQNAGAAVMMVADGDAEFTKAAGLELDLTGKGLGLRCQRFAMVVENGVVKSLDIDASGLDKTSAESILGRL
ncbi:MAG: redoxin family protein [Rhodospirillales bacterium]